ncbi:ABC transporter ATP-binding protein [Ostreiculturibacter nitratireducens]|uniref:ABC transporter ATP-binding protein n=1 Tax=Ostreiculturibacter nitratireducens TaxID=3075226 RepID=UPI0031B5B592
MTKAGSEGADTDTGGATLPWLWRNYLRPRRALILAAFLLMAAEGATMGALSYLVKPMFDRVFVGGNADALIWVALAIGGVFALRASTSFGHRVLMARVGEGMIAGLQANLLSHLMRLDPSFYQEHPPGSLIERVRGDTQTLRNLATSILAAVGRDAVALVGLLAVAISVDWVWTLVALSGAPLLMIPVVALQRLVRRMSRNARTAAAELSTRLDEIFHGQSTIRLTGTEAREARRFGDSQKGYVRAQIRSEAGSAGIPALIDLVAGLGFALVLSYGGMQIIAGEKTIGDFMSFFTAMALIFEPLRRLGGVSGSWAVMEASIERIRELFNLRPTILSPARPVAPPTGPGEAEIRFEDVRFSYGRQPVLDGVSFTALPGRTTAIVGPSGAGKSTLFALLTRLADPQAGRVTLGGIDTRDFSLPALRTQFSLVAQDTALFDETIRENILMGLEGVSESRLAEAIEAANLTDFVAGLPNGLDTAAGPRGSGLSGGQRQRVAIARALLRDAPVLLLDEATSALDAASERAVQEALGRLSVGRTTLVIAHRLSTVRGADKILVMDKGRVVEEGTHDELYAKGGLYAGLCRLQFAE